MEIQPLLADQRAKIDVHRSPESVPTRKSLFLLALDVPKRIADVLKIETHTALQQVRSLAAPVPEEVAVRALTPFRDCPGQGAVPFARSENRLALQMPKDRTIIERESVAVGRTCKTLSSLAIVSFVVFLPQRDRHAGQRDWK